MVQWVNAHVRSFLSLHPLMPGESTLSLAEELLRSGFVGLQLQQFLVLDDKAQFQIV
jgi:hypothetical protein